jgi:hypothetical protein
MKCPNFTTFDNAALDALKVLPPLEPKDKTISWARGSIRDSDFNELIVTGPRLPVLYSGCRFNSIVLSIRGPGADDPSFAFEGFLHKVLSRVENEVGRNVEKFRPGLKNANLLQFDRDFIRPSSYGADLPNELRVKLAIKHGYSDEGEVADLVETVFVDEEGNNIESGDIAGGSEIIPIIRVSFFRNSNRFGLNLTLLKGLVFPTSKKRKLIDFSELQFDHSN